MKTADDLLHLTEKTKKLEDQLHLFKAELEESKNLEEALSHLFLGLIFVTSSGKISYFNQAAETITGIKRHDVIGKPYKDVFSDTLFGFSMKQTLLEKEKKKTIFLTLNNGKKEVPLEVFFSLIPDKGIFLALRDAEEMRQMKQTLDRNDRLKELGEMAARLAHEIRNPLGGIGGFAELLLRDLKDRPHQAHMASAIIEGTRLLNRLVTNVLSYARPLEVHFAQYDLISMIEKVIDLVMAEEKEGRKCLFKPSESPFLITIDKELFEMALLNILRNAMQSVPSRKCVRVFVYKEKTKACVSVQDEGEGILKSHLEKIFTPFFTTKAQGSGLGLSEAHKAISALGGTIEVATQEKQGTTFTIKIPTV